MHEDFRAIQPHEFEDCLDLWSTVFVHTGRDYFVPYLHGDPYYNPELTRVCVVDGKIVSALQICRREVRIGNNALTMGGIANVATHPEYRGRGYASQLLLDSLMIMPTHSIDFSMLFTGIQPFYERAGWCSLPMKRFTGELRQDLPAEESTHYSFRTADWKYDVVKLLPVYEEFNQQRPLTVVRTVDYWKGYSVPRFGAPKSTIIAETSGYVAGYLYFQLDGENCWLHEIGFLRSEAECARALILNAAAQASTAGVRRLWSNLPSESVIMDALHSVVTSVEVREPAHMMCRIISMDSLKHKVLPELNDRASVTRPPSGIVNLDTDYGTFGLKVKRGHVCTVETSESRTKMAQSQFFSLLFGVKNVRELSLNMTTTETAIVDALFPEQRPVYWQPDHF